MRNMRKLGKHDLLFAFPMNFVAASLWLDNFCH